MKKRIWASMLALCMVLTLMPISALADGDTDIADLTNSVNWVADRTEPSDFKVENGKISFAVKENPEAESWYAWQGRIAYTGIPVTGAWEVEYTLDITEEMLSQDNINASVWIQVDQAGEDTVQSQKNTVDWCIVKYSNENNTATWQTWSSSGAGEWGNSDINPTQGEHTVKTTFDNGTITQYIDDVQINSYVVDASETSPAALIAQARSYGSAFNVEIGVPTIDYGVAQINDTKYATLVAAVNAAVEGDTVTLLTDVALTSCVIVRGKNITLDLNDRSITRGDGNQTNWLIGVAEGAGLTIEDTGVNQTGSIKSANFKMTVNEEEVTYAGYDVLTNGSLTVKSGTFEGYYGFLASGANAVLSVEGGTVTGDYAALNLQKHSQTIVSGDETTLSGKYGVLVYGDKDDSNNPTSLTVNGGKICGQDFAIAGNGIDDYTSIIINDGVITSESLGIYHPQVGDLTINGGSITAPNGVQYCGAGNLTITGGIITATSGYSLFPEKPSDQNDGSTDDGAALSIISRGGGYQNENEKMNISITGGEFISLNNAAVSIYRLQKVGSSWVTNVSTDVSNYLESLTIGNAEDGTGPVFVGSEKKGALEIDVAAVDEQGNSVVAISGGEYSSSVIEYVVEELRAELYSVAKNEDAPYSYYTDVSEALADAASIGGEVTDLTVTDGNVATEIKLVNGDDVQIVKSAVGKEITLPKLTREGYTFEGWADEDGNVYNAGEEITVEGDITLTAQWKRVPVSSAPVYGITAPETVNGTVTVVNSGAPEGQTVIITVEADRGYELDELIVTDARGRELELTDRGDGRYSFTMPATAVEIEASFVRADGGDETRFADVAADAWYYDAVEYVDENGLMTGMTTTTFEPGTALNRGMLVTILYRLEGQPAAGTSQFNDIADSDWYATAVAWAAANGIVTGYEDGSFRPNRSVTREEMAAILYRYAAYKGYDVSARAGLSGYTDAGNIQSYAAEPMQWANAEGLITGYPDNTLQPQSGANRAVAATILMRFCENIVR